MPWRPLARGNDALEAAIVKADGATRALTAEYTTTSQDVAAYQARLDELAKLVAEVQGSAAALPTRISLPSVSMHGAVGSASAGGGGGGGRAPAVRTTTKASGAP